jgi:predicted nucleotidyltransferase
MSVLAALRGVVDSGYNQGKMNISLPAIEHYFAALDEVVLAYLFGSHARGEAGPLSDIDIAVLLRETCTRQEAFDLRLEIIGGLMRIIGADDVDVIVLNEAPLALQYRVLRDGRLIFCRDRQAMIEHRARTVSYYLDFKPFLDRHEAAILDRARRGELLHGYNPHRGALERYRRLRERFTGHAGSHV